jgi:DNA-binding transcriptional LysR family regulator
MSDSGISEYIGSCPATSRKGDFFNSDQDSFRIESALTWITAVASFDMLALSARQFAAAPMIRSVIERIAIHEALDAPPIMWVQRSAIPLTPAAQHFSDLLEREARRQLPK